MSNLDIRPVDFRTAQEFVREHHRHNKPPPGHKFSIGCYAGDKLVGVAMVGRPVGRYLDDSLTLEVNRCCTDGTKNACLIVAVPVAFMVVVVLLSAVLAYQRFKRRRR